MRERWERFCQEYIVDTSAEQAAIRAGYSPRSAAAAGSRLLRRAEIRDRIDALTQGIRAEQGRCIADATEVMHKLTRILRGETEEPVKISESIRAAELLGKRYGLYTERPQAGEEVPAEDAREELLARLLRLRDA